ncbi:DNA mismatch repair endonuclease MutL [Carnobacterium sp. ISL-102]|uniref:DNA mismatch repair endonuclease MutL n=1 Tax=Carnobacterium sp. ISL-102 TaxID=2819142 RepID=UPI001BE85535|nr:DNA mismatch repair endonuclease MutL [Carnobacterium sp. ISL-102]MBT2731258.1 DNA mismatch repair endonuclease MutL [Carnobacterium sp. ISL-102]
MAKILELSDVLANQIAAGEVIERPASVVKELIENAIDAESSQIDILIEEAGLKKIQIIDNGMGIEPEEVQNAFKRHATSKIYSRDDLFRIRTLGFRGEALPSIASVSEVVLETSTGGERGTYLSLKGGKIIEERPNEARKGSKITIENLFFNTPARLKYVKSLQAELSNVTDIINRLAISHPKIAFRLISDGNQLLRTAGNGDLKQTLAGIYGVATAKKMREIKKEDLDFRVSGFISLPELTRASRNYISIIINGRYIKNYLLNKAIISGYRSKLMVGRYPIVAIKIDMDPLLVDVNVHPTKQEVRISKEKELMQLIESAIHDCLSKEQLIPDGLENLSFKKKINLPMEENEQTTFRFQQERTPEKEKKESENFQPLPESHYSKQQSLSFEGGTDHEIEKEPFLLQEEQEDTLVELSEKNKISEFHDETISELIDYHQESPLKAADKLMKKQATVEESIDQFPTLEYVGQMHGTYLFAQNEKGLYILDQHAAQERIKYEYFREKIGEVSTDLQDLLVPIMLDYPNSDAIKIKENSDALEMVGIFLEPFGQNSFLLRSHPVWFNQGEEETIVSEMIDLLLDHGSVSVAKFREATAIMMSCKGSIKANHYLNDAEARALLKDLKKMENPYNCPHGRPVVIHFTNKDMEKMFKRIQDPH